MGITPDTNITRDYFDNFHDITDKDGRPLVSIYWSYSAPEILNYGTMYLIHGYGGSPIEPCLKLPMQQALAFGFNVVAIEGADLSATAMTDKDINSMTLQRQKQALAAGLRYAATIPNMNTAHKIAWAHSISCRALAELIVDNKDIRDYFSEMVLNNPYFLAPPKVQNMHKKMMQKDPSGKTWDALTKKSSNMPRQIENYTFKIPTCLYNLCVPLPPMWAKQQENIREITRKMSHFIKQLRMYCVLGTADNMADYQQNRQLIQSLPIAHKQLISIHGANHSFENALTQYQQFVRVIINSIRMHIGNGK